MKNPLSNSAKSSLLLIVAAAIANFATGQDQNKLTMTEQLGAMGNAKPVPVSLEGFSGEVAEVLRFDLYVQGFSFVAPDAAQYLISGSNADNVQGRVTDRFSKSSLLARSYTGASLRRQAHAFADDIVFAIRHEKARDTRAFCISISDRLALLFERARAVGLDIRQKSGQQPEDGQE